MYSRILFFLLTFLFTALGENLYAAENGNSSQQPEIITLESCLHIAFNNSQELKAAAQNITIAKEKVRQAESGIWPTLGYEITASDSDQNQIGWLVGINSQKLSSASISLTQPLYTGGNVTKGIKLAKLNLETAKEDECKARQTLIYNVKSAYYQVWLSQQMIKVAQDAYDNMGRHAQQVKDFYEVGKASRFDLLRAQVEHENLKPAVIKAQNGVVMAKLNLSNIIGFEKKRKFIISDDLSQLQLLDKVELDSDTLLGQAFLNRPELKKFAKMQEMARIQTALATAGYKPTVALVGTYQGSSVGGYDPGNWNDSKQWTLALNIKGDFFDGFLTPAKVGEVKANQRLVEINETKLQDGIHFDVKQSLQEIKESLEISCANRASVNLAKESLEMTEAKFEVQMATMMDVRDSQLALDQALSGYYAGIASYLTALAKLDLNIGKDSL